MSPTLSNIVKKVTRPHTPRECGRPDKSARRSSFPMLLALLTSACSAAAPSVDGRSANTRAIKTETTSRSNTQIQAHSAGGKTYFHLELELHAHDLITSGPVMERELAYHLTDGGQFEIYIQPELIPASKPDCQQGIIVRMPWTNPKSPNADIAVKKKKLLYTQIMQLRANNSIIQKVVVELNPYISINSDNPKNISLTQCNVFFRHARGEYIDKLGPLDL